MAGTDSRDIAEVNCRYGIGQTLYLELPEQKQMIEFEVAEIKLSKRAGILQKMYGIVTNDLEYQKNTPNNSIMYLLESEIDRYHAKNTELLNEVRGQLDMSLYTTGERYANIELDNGRHLSVNEIRHNGKFTDQYNVSLYASSSEIQKKQFHDSGYLLKRLSGPESADFLYKALQEMLKENDRIPVPKFFEERKEKSEPISNFHSVLDYVVKPCTDSSNVLITNSAGQSIVLNILEFWEIVKAGNRRDIRNEIDEILYQTDAINDIPVYLLEDNERALNMVIEKVRDIRIGRENENQIYEAFDKLKQELRDVLQEAILHEIDRVISVEKLYAGISGYELRTSDAAKEIIADYIFKHELEPRDHLSEYIFQAIEDCHDALKIAITNNRTESLDEKIQGTANGKEKSSRNSRTKTIEDSMER